MPTISKLTALAANAVANPFQGDQYEIIGFPARAEFAVVAEATGVLATIFSGSDLLQQAAPATQRAAGVPPVYPDDFLVDDVADVNDRLQVSLQNTTAGAINVRTVCRLTPL